MYLRIIIDWEVKKGKEVDFGKLLTRLRSQAIFSKGYISGEMLRVQDNPKNYIVITAWQSVADWEKYVKQVEISNKPFQLIYNLLCLKTLFGSEPEEMTQLEILVELGVKLVESHY